jgi:hypothetical protein
MAGRPGIDLGQKGQGFSVKCPQPMKADAPRRAGSGEGWFAVSTQWRDNWPAWKSEDFSAARAPQSMNPMDIYDLDEF